MNNLPTLSHLTKTYFKEYRISIVNEYEYIFLLTILRLYLKTIFNSKIYSYNEYILFSNILRCV